MGPWSLSLGAHLLCRDPGIFSRPRSSWLCRLCRVAGVEEKISPTCITAVFHSIRRRYLARNAACINREMPRYEPHCSRHTATDHANAHLTGLTMLLRLAPVAFVLLWATGFIGAKLGAPYAEPFTFLSIRFLIVVPLMVVVALLWRATWPSAGGAAHAVVSGALIHGAYLGGVFWAIDNGISAGASALIVGLQPVTTAVLAAPLLRERITPRQWTGLALGLLGVALVLLPKADLTSAGATPATVAACVLALLAITGGTIYQKRFGTGTNLMTGAVWQYTGALLVVGVASLLLETREITWHPDFIFALVWLVLVLSIGAVTLLMVLLRHADVSRVAALFYLVPAVVAVVAWAMFNETLGPLQLMGIVLVAVAVILASQPSASNKVKTTGT